MKVNLQWLLADNLVPFFFCLKSDAQSWHNGVFANQNVPLLRCLSVVPVCGVEGSFRARTPFPALWRIAAR